MEETLVKLNVPLSERVIRLSVLDQQAQRNYANLLLVFELDKANRVNDIVGHLKQGLEVALSEVPDFASTVHPLPGSKRNELELRLGPESGVPFRVVNHAASAGTPQGQQNPLAARSYADLASGNFPLADIPQDILLAPRPTCEDACPEGLSGLLAQINLIDGGVIMALSWHHTVSDARGVNTLVNSWARHTKTSILQGKVASPEVPAEQTRERWRLEYGSPDATITQLSNYVINHLVRSPLSSSSPHLLDRPDPAAATATVSTWYFSPKALQSLRSDLSETRQEDAQFTRSEAVSALIWKHLSQARLLHHAAPEGTSLFSTRIDFRARAKPSFHDEYLGNINEPNARARIPLREVCEPSTSESLAVLARVIRDAVSALDEKAMRDFIGVVERLPVVTDLAWRYDTFPGPDLGVTDMSGMDTLRQDWGAPLGHPVCIRSASREKGLAYVLPQDRDGGFEVQLQCERDAVERLKKDDLFTRYAQFQC
jgi:hypothetical protein